MINNNSPKRRVYVFYILGILLSATVLTVDIFSDKSVSTYLSNKLSVLSPTPIVSSNFRFPEIEIFKSKSKLINENIHLILKTGHPSPLSANRGYWFGNKHFSKCKSFLTENNIKPIAW